MPPIVSVIIPAYQNAATLPRAIHSVLAQDFTDYELIIVNNGSSDSTSKIILEAERRDSRVRGIHLDVNQRPAGGRNAGVEAANGELVAFLDADDEWLPEKLSRQVALLKKYPDYDLVFTDSWNVNVENGRIDRQSDGNSFIMQQLEFEPVPGSLQTYFVNGTLAQTIYTKSFINMSSSLLRKASFLQVGGFNTDRFGTEDVDFWVRFSRKSKFIYCHQPTVRCFQGAGTSALSERWMRELVSYHRMCLASPDYADLREIALNNLLKIYRYLIVYYALSTKPIKAMRIFQESLDLGFNTRLAVYSLVSFMGPAPYWIGQWFTSLRQKQKPIVKNIFS